MKTRNVHTLSAALFLTSLLIAPYGFCDDFFNDGKKEEEEKTASATPESTLSTDLGLQYIKEHKYDEAIQIFEELIKADSSSLSSYISLANVYKAKEDKDKVVETYQRGIDVLSQMKRKGSEDRTDDAALLYILKAEYLLLLENGKEAISAVEGAIALNPKNPGVFLRGGWVYFHLNEKSKAKDLCEEGLFKAKLKNQKIMINKIEQAMRTMSKDSF